MLLDGYSIAEKKIVTFDEEFPSKDQIQPNGVDLRAYKIYEVQGKAFIPREKKAEGDFIVKELQLKDGYWHLGTVPNTLYYIDFFEIASVPDGYCGIIHTRSSLVRAGLDIQAGLYDTGFSGRIGGSMRIYSDMTIEYGARIAQIVLTQSKFRGLRYEGRYQNTDSQTAIVS